MGEQGKPKRFSFKTAAFAAGGILAVLFLIWFVLEQVGPRTVDFPETRPLPRFKDEEIVLAFIKSNANHAKAVEVERWGPHDLKMKLADLLPQLKTKGFTLIRVCDRTKNTVGALVIQDQIFLVQDGRASLFMENLGDDDWIEFLGKAVAELEKAKVSSARAQAKVIAEAAKRYAVEHNGIFPDTLDQMLLKDLDGKGPYFETPDALNDPWGRRYNYDKNGPINMSMGALVQIPDVYTRNPNPPNQIIGNWK